MEQSDLIVVTKYDGDLIPAARRVAYEYMSALKYLRSPSKHWKSKVIKESYIVSFYFDTSY